MTHTFIVELTDEVKGYEEDVERIERTYGAEEFDLSEHDKEIYNNALDNFIKSFEAIDNCEFATFTLCLIKEMAEKLRK